MKFDDDYEDDFWQPENEVERQEEFDITDNEIRKQFSIELKFKPFNYNE